MGLLGKSQGLSNCVLPPSPEAKVDKQKGYLLKKESVR